MWLIIPFKGKEEIKQRLSARLNEQQRSDLAFAMFASLLTAFEAFAKANPRVIEKVMVVSRDKQCLQHKVMPRFQQLSVSVFEEPKSCEGLNQALELSLQQAESDGAKRALIIHADLPLVSEDDIAVLMNDIANKNDKSLHIIQDKSKTGTNALMVPLPLLMPLQFGEGSCQKHVKQAMLQGLPVKLLQQAQLAFDVDEVDDLAALFHV